MGGGVMYILVGSHRRVQRARAESGRKTRLLAQTVFDAERFQLSASGFRQGTGNALFSMCAKNHVYTSHISVHKLCLKLTSPVFRISPPSPVHGVGATPPRRLETKSRRD